MSTRPMRMRTLLLLPLLLIPVLLTGASLLLLRHQVRQQMQNALDADVLHSSATFRNLEQSRRTLLRHEALLLAEQPSLRALMTTQDATTIQNEAGDYVRLTGSDLFGLAMPSGSFAAWMLKHGPAPLPTATAQTARLLSSSTLSTYVFSGHTLYEVATERIYFRPREHGTLLGYVIVGAAIDRNVAQQVGQSTSGEVAFSVGNEVVSSTLPPGPERALAALLTHDQNHNINPSSVLAFGGAQYDITRLPLTNRNQLPIQLILLKSLNGLRQQQAQLNRTLLAIGIGAFAVGAILAIGLARLLTSPLEGLLAGVRALGTGNYEKSLPGSGPREVVELSTAIATMRQQIRKAQTDLVEAERLATIGQMASSISHDLRHYLASVYANSEFLATSSLTAPEKAELLKEIQLSVQGTTDLIDSLLLFSRTGVSMNTSHESLAYVAERAVALLRGHPEAAGVSISLAVFGEAETIMDGKKIERVIYNLVLNACQSARSAEAPQQVSVEVTQSEAQVLVRVADSGAGVPQAIRHRLFEPFISANKESGVGIGLTLASSIAREHGGSVQLESSAAGCTVFVLTLPRTTGLPAATVYPMPLEDRSPQ